MASSGEVEYLSIFSLYAQWHGEMATALGVTYWLSLAINRNIIYGYVKRGLKMRGTLATASSLEQPTPLSAYAVGTALSTRCRNKNLKAILFEGLERNKDDEPHEDCAAVLRGLANNNEIFIKMDVRSYLYLYCSKQTRPMVWNDLLRPLRQHGVKFVFPLETNRIPSWRARYEVAQEDDNAVDSLVKVLLDSDRRIEANEKIIRPFYLKRVVKSDHPIPSPRHHR